MFTGPNIPKDGLEFMIDPANEKSTGGFLRDQNLLDYSTWTVGNTSATGFSRNGGSDENIIETGTGPYGESAIIWAARNNTESSNSDGGWNTSQFVIDNTKMYRFSVWAYRQVVGDGRFYFGCHGRDANGSNIGVNYRGNIDGSTTNPYFWVSGTTGGGLTDGWTLFIGHVWPYGTVQGGNHPDSGRYTISGGRVANISNDYVWKSNGGKSYHRTYLYYSTLSSTVQLHAYPRVDIVDGTEPSVQDLLDGKSRTLTNLANPSNTVFQVNNLKIKTSDYFNHRRNRVLDFDGTDDLITTSFGSGRNVASNPFTVIAWVKADVTNANMMWVDVGGNGSNQRFYSTLINGDTRNFGIQATGWSDSQPDDTNWHHQAIVMDGSTARGYDNGVQVQTLGYTSYTLPGAIRFGGRSGYYWNGQIAKTKIYNRALSANEIARDYNATKGRFN